MIFWAVRVVVLLAIALPGTQKRLDHAQVTQIQENLLASASHSWELGTASEALIEAFSPALSVFSTSAFPPFESLYVPFNTSEVRTIVDNVLSRRPPDSPTFIPGEGSSADPASLGVAILLVNWTQGDVVNSSYSDAISAEINYLLNSVPRSDAGAISHRAGEVQLWSDFLYMVPPFIAYYGALHKERVGSTFLQMAYDQCRLYRDALRDESGLWRHVALGSWQDNRHWATGNAWAAAGMLRVLQTLNHSSYAAQFTDEQADLAVWIYEITAATWKYQATNGTLLNVLDDPSSFGDTASTALLASVTYRMAALTNDATFISCANKALNLVHSSIDASGWLLNAVNPYTFSSALPAGEHSPEGQAFVLLLDAAWKQFNKDWS